LVEATIASGVALLVMAAFRWSDQRGWWRRIPILGRPGGGKYLVLMAVLVPPGIILALHGMVGVINLVFPGDPMKAQFHWDYYGKGVFGGWLLLLEFFIFKSWQDTRDEARLSQLKARELEKERLQALLNQLKDQMNPHFLFNTLNTVAALIPENPSKAEQVVVKLSALLQGILASTRRTHHSLSKELEFCGDYLEIEQVRFGQRLNWRLSIDPPLDPAKLEIPVLLLQPIVENAVKHGLSSLASGGNLWIKARVEENCLFIQIIDDGVGFGKSPYAGSGTALANCRKRIELAYGEGGRLDIQDREGGGTQITLRLPLDHQAKTGGET
jgi:signal transduction histidine kinase